jgi:4-aminobutyrate aminotransferase-like enzyme
MFFAVEMVKDRATKEPAGAETKRIVNTMRDRGVLISRIGIHDNILKIRPPMVFSKQNADLLLRTLDDVLTGL